MPRKTFSRIAAAAIVAALAIIGILSVVKPQRVAALGFPTITVIGTITDAAGVPYAGGSIDATLIPTGVTPTVPTLNGQVCGTGGCQITGYIQPVSINTDGTFAIVVYCNTGCSAPISPSGTQWLFTVRNKGTQPPAGYGGVSFTVTETIGVTQPTQDIGADLRAAAPRLLVSAAAGAGPVTGSGTTGFLPKWTSTTGLGNSSCDDSVTTAATVTCTHSLATTGNISITGGTIFTGALEASTAQGGTLDMFCDATVSCTVEMGLNTANEGVQIAGGSIAMNSITGASLSNGSGGLIGGLKGGGTLNAQGLFVNGVAPVQLVAAANVTPVTAAASSAAPQNLQSVTFGVSNINTTGKTFRVKSSGTLVPSAGGSVKSGLNMLIGGVQVLGQAVFTPATTGTYSWTFDATCTVTNASTSGIIVCSGTQNFGGVSGSTTQLDNATYPFFATFNPANTLTAGSVQMQVQFSTSSTSNTATGDYEAVEFLN